MGTPEQTGADTRPRPSNSESSCFAAEVKDDSHCAERIGSHVQLPEDMLRHIHALIMPMRDAAQAACGLMLFCALGDAIPNSSFLRVDHIVQNHSGMGVKEFRLQYYPCSTIDPSYIDHWIQVAVTPGIKEFELSLFDIGDIKYSFPYSLLFSERVSSIQSLILAGCSIHSMAQVGCMNSLTNLDLHSVDTTGEELLCFLSNSFALEKISLGDCGNIICLKIPYQLQNLNVLGVLDCQMLEMIDSDAPTLSAFLLKKKKKKKKNLSFLLYKRAPNTHLAWTCITTIAPNLQTLFLTCDETVNTPVAFGKFLQLRYLEIMLSAPNFSPDFDFCSLVSFLDASPALETLNLRIGLPTI
ncbi:hypothetical protein U9M48_002590 [Paspalum notatum var. saurae]|uniref:At1g61320/AtMIF1 LRR domain-containing protein n=1 Tax=Paspalum notatum var. saurae TaxID=547442 RepID=A0AAQ3PR83_PASNO